MRDHSQEADHWANWGAEEPRKIVVGMEGGARHLVNGRSGCGEVIKGVDRNRWVTISKIAVPQGVGTAMGAEVMGVCVLPSILDLVLHKSQRLQYQLVYRHTFSSIIDVVLVQKSRKLEEFGNLLLRKRASPKFDVEGTRHSDTRDLRLVPSENFPEPDSGVLPAHWTCQSHLQKD